MRIVRTPSNRHEFRTLYLLCWSFVILCLVSVLYILRQPSLSLVGPNGSILKPRLPEVIAVNVYCTHRCHPQKPWEYIPVLPQLDIEGTQFYLYASVAQIGSPIESHAFACVYCPETGYGRQILMMCRSKSCSFWLQQAVDLFIWRSFWSCKLSDSELLPSFLLSAWAEQGQRAASKETISSYDLAEKTSFCMWNKTRSRWLLERVWTG